MKILITIPCLLTGGTEIQTLNLVRALVQGGHQVIVACYFEYTLAMVQCYQDNGSKVICLSPDGTRIGGWKGILFLFKSTKGSLKNENRILPMYNIWLRELSPFFFYGCWA